MDEHRIGLKPIARGAWAPIKERPIALGHHRFEWLYVTGFVEPATGRTDGVEHHQRRLQAILPANADAATASRLSAVIC
jgi:hypothetical protein